MSGECFTEDVRGLCSPEIFSGLISHTGMSEGMSWMRVRVTMQDYKSLPVAVMICATLVNTQTHIKTDRQVLAGYILKARSGELKN